MTDLEIMQKAKTYVDKLANGINPLDDTEVSECDIINNIKISRCLFYVSDVLRKVIDNDGKISNKTTPKEEFNISFEDIQKFPFSNIPIPISEIAKRINNITHNENMKKISHKHLTDWLISIEMLRLETQPDGKTTKRPTESGIKLGITTEIRHGMQNNYTVVLYNLSAQHFVIDNIESAIAIMNK